MKKLKDVKLVRKFLDFLSRLKVKYKKIKYFIWDDCPWPIRALEIFLVVMLIGLVFLTIERIELKKERKLLFAKLFNKDPESLAKKALEDKIKLNPSFSSSKELQKAFGEFPRIINGKAITREHMEWYPYCGWIDYSDRFDKYYCKDYNNASTMLKLRAEFNQGLRKEILQYLKEGYLVNLRINEIFWFKSLSLFEKKPLRSYLEKYFIRSQSVDELLKIDFNDRWNAIVFQMELEIKHSLEEADPTEFRGNFYNLGINIEEEIQEEVITFYEFTVPKILERNKTVDETRTFVNKHYKKKDF